MKLTSILIALCCSLVLFSACKKSENDEDNNNKSATEKILEDGKWQLSASTATVNYKGSDTTLDQYAKMDECEKDNFVQFAYGGKATEDQNTNKCAGKPEVETATWALLNNDTKLAIVDSNPDTMDLEITTAQMKLKHIKPNSSGSPVTYIATYKNIK